MKNHLGHPLSIRLRRAVMTIIASGIVGAPAVHANPSNNIVVVPPTDLPALARQSSDAMLLRETMDGKALLYVEQEQGARLAIFDVTDPVHIKGAGSVQLGSAGPFDFVSPIGSKQELIQYRQGHTDAVLDFHKVNLPNLEAVQGLTLQGQVTPLGNDGFIVASQATEAPPARDFQVVDATSAQMLNTVFDVKQVHEKISKADTGTTFLLADDGLYVVRRPAVEWQKKRREEEWFFAHNGG
jgi:hypothetical protein